MKPARETDREKIFNWLTRSDLTEHMMGPPRYTDHPIPSWEEFCRDYSPAFFDSSGDGKCRQYIIMISGGMEIGTIGYDLLNREKNRVLLDIWMRAERYCGQGFGSDALVTLCNHIHGNYGINRFMISPSARNRRAVAAYRKAGFSPVKQLDRAEQEKEFGTAEYDDNIIMIKEL